MKDFLLTFVSAALAAIPITMGLCFLYVSLALAVVEIFRLNYSKRPIGYYMLTAAFVLAFFSYFFVLAFLVRELS